ncbi:hypothetical protein D3C81_1167270 [compost metagenome]
MRCHHAHRQSGRCGECRTANFTVRPDGRVLGILLWRGRGQSLLRAADRRTDCTADRTVQRQCQPDRFADAIWLRTGPVTAGATGRPDGKPPAGGRLHPGGERHIAVRRADPFTVDVPAVVFTHRSDLGGRADPCAVGGTPGARGQSWPRRRQYHERSAAGYSVVAATVEPVG